MVDPNGDARGGRPALPAPGARAAGERPGPTSDLFQAVGARVRALRLSHQLTLDELSAVSGVSRRMITLLEAGETNASLGTLDKLARALRCDFSALVPAGPTAPLRPTTAATAPPLWEDGCGSAARLLVSGAGSRLVELWHWELAGGARYDAEPDTPGSQEIIHVTTGSLTVAVGEDRYRLPAGGSLRVPTDRPCAYANEGRRPVRFVRFSLVP